jgi:hypothetical protein
MVLTETYPSTKSKLLPATPNEKVQCVASAVAFPGRYNSIIRSGFLSVPELGPKIRLVAMRNCARLPRREHGPN